MHVAAMNPECSIFHHANLGYEILRTSRARLKLGEKLRNMFPQRSASTPLGISFLVSASLNRSSSNKLRHSSLIICFYWLAPANSFSLLCAITFTLPSFSPFDILFAVARFAFALAVATRWLVSSKQRIELHWWTVVNDHWNFIKTNTGGKRSESECSANRYYF